MPNACVHQVHFADAALVLLEGRDLLRIRRPEYDRTIAHSPAGVVGGVAEVLHTVGGKLLLGAGGHFTNPQVMLADEDCALAVGRKRFVASAASGCRAAASPAASTTASPALGVPLGGTTRAIDTASEP